MEIPFERISPQALKKIVEEFILREGTDYGFQDLPLEVKAGQVLKQLERGQAFIDFDPGSESCDIRRR